MPELSASVAAFQALRTLEWPAGIGLPRTLVDLPLPAPANDTEPARPVPRRVGERWPTHDHSGSLPVPDEPAIREHLDFITRRWAAEFPRALIEIRTIDPRSKDVTSQLYSIERLDEAAHGAAEDNRAGLNVYVCVNPVRPDFKPARRGGAPHDEDIVGAVLAYADIDDETSAKAAHEHLADLRPTRVIITGTIPGLRLHLYWEFEDAIRNLDAWRRLQAGIIHRLKADAAIKNPSRIMKLPGSVSWAKADKRAKGYVHEAVKANGSASGIVPIDWLAAFFPPAPAAAKNGAARGDGVDTEKALDDIREGRDWHANVLRLVGRLVAKGLGDGDITAMLASQITTAGYTVEQTRADLAVMLKGARDKGFDQPPPPPPPPDDGEPANGHDPEPPPGWGEIPDDEPMSLADRPKIKLENGIPFELSARAGELALLKCGTRIFQRGGVLVQPVVAKVRAADGGRTLSHQLAIVSPATLRGMLDTAVNFKKFDGRVGDWVDTHCPKEIAETLLGFGTSNLRDIVGIISAPTLRFDGSVLDQPGYDEATGLLFEAGGVNFPAIPDRPTRQQALEARDLICDLLAEFPFVTGQLGADAGVAFSGFATALIRRSLPAAPLHAVSAPSAGSGKSFLIDLKAMVATGQRAPVAALSGKDDEDEKRLNAHLLAGDSLLSLDNASNAIGGDRLCQILSQEIVSLRPLGVTRIVKVETAIAMFATGNNLAFTDDVPRRTLLCNLDPKKEKPEEREFAHNPMDLVKADRGRYVVAVLTIMRAYIAAGRPNPGRPLAGYEDWCRMVRDPLVWLDFADPVDTMAKVAASDNKLERAAELFRQWHQAFGAITVKDAIATACKREEVPILDAAGKAVRDEAGNIRTKPTGRFLNPGLHDAIEAVAASRGREQTIDNVRLGHWLAKHKDRVIGGLTLTGERSGEGTAALLWKVT